MKQESYAWYVGIDWATESHQVCVVDPAGNLVKEWEVEHSGASIAQLADDLLARAEGDPDRIAVAIEVPHGAVVSTLIERGIAVFALNPKQLDRFRDRHNVAGAKDDRLDAFVLGTSLRTDMKCFRRVQLGDADLVVLRELVRVHHELGQEVNALANRLRDLLVRFYPQPLKLGSVHSCQWLWDLLELAPTPEQGARLTEAAIDDLLRQHHIRRVSAERVAEVLRAPALRVAPGVAEACSRHIALLLPRLRLATAQQHQCHWQMERLLAQLCSPREEADADEGPAHAHRDAAIILSLPGVGTIVAATVLAEASQALGERDYPSLRSQCGVAPVTRQTGKQKRRKDEHGKASGKPPPVSMRYACNGRLREAVYHWARVSITQDFRCHEYYAELRRKGHSHGRALRGIGDRLLALLVAMLKSGSLFDPFRWNPPRASAPPPPEAPVRSLPRPHPEPEPPAEHPSPSPTMTPTRRAQRGSRPPKAPRAAGPERSVGP